MSSSDYLRHAASLGSRQDSQNITQEAVKHERIREPKPDGPVQTIGYHKSLSTNGPGIPKPDVPHRLSHFAIISEPSFS